MFLNFKGGKGVATSLGALLGVAPYVGLSGFAFFGVVVALFGWISLGSVCAAISLPLFSTLFYPNDTGRLVFCLFATCMALYKHRANIERLRNKTEPKVKFPWNKVSSKQ